jgi:hypothetical protein
MAQGGCAATRMDGIIRCCHAGSKIIVRPGPDDMGVMVLMARLKA